MIPTKLKQPHVTVIFMGDSITEGQYVHHSKRWTEIVTAECKQMATREGFDADMLYFFNRGVSGDTTRMALERFARDVQAYEPDVMTIQFGLNDGNCWFSDRGLPRVSEAGFRANLTEMIVRAKVFGTKRILISTNHPTMRHEQLSSGKSLEDQRRVYNDIIRDVARTCEVQLCDIDTYIQTAYASQISQTVLPPPDLLHLSEFGHNIYAELLGRTLAPVILESCKDRLIR